MKFLTSSADNEKEGKKKHAPYGLKARLAAGASLETTKPCQQLPLCFTDSTKN